ncbi:DUF2141 domain-containing protein [Maribacter ulvicola]|uniref:Uncharacterized protein n=1 Tax=Maribacter ulvicola TaxID=228959 RepID=A0A1N6ZCY9_9FLAO|nr:DUF2141 domain-containing protein [Maribacter ulvicola]SIR24631.1 hypothetical protein SAMN05421797_108134 [Maribacter ulvicola]
MTINAQKKDGIILKAVFKNLVNSEGHLLSSLHNKNTFMKAEGLQSSNNKTEVVELILTFENLQSGEFAFSKLHDQ